MNSKDRFDIIEKLLGFGVDHVVDDILMMLDIEDLAQFSQVNRWKSKKGLSEQGFQDKICIFMSKMFIIIDYGIRFWMTKALTGSFENVQYYPENHNWHS